MNIFNYKKVAASAVAFRLTMRAAANSYAVLEITSAGAYGLSTAIWSMSSPGRIEVIYGPMPEEDIHPGQYGAYAVSKSRDGWINGSGLYAADGWLLQAASTQENAEPSKFIRWKAQRAGFIGLQVLTVSV